jgi:hypothetical protein
MEHMCREIKSALLESRSNHFRKVSRIVNWEADAARAAIITYSFFSFCKKHTKTHEGKGISDAEPNWDSLRELRNDFQRGKDFFLWDEECWSLDRLLLGSFQKKKFRWFSFVCVVPWNRDEQTWDYLLASEGVIFAHFSSMQHLYNKGER